MQDELELLKKEYAEQLPERIGAIHQASDAICQALGNRRKANWGALETAAHKLAGSSGTYGFKAVSVVARYMEDLISESRAQKMSPQHAIAHLSRWFDMLAAAATHVAQHQLAAEKDDGQSLLQELKDHYSSFASNRRAA